MFLLLALLFFSLSVLTVWLYLPAFLLLASGALAVLWYLPAYVDSFSVTVDGNSVTVNRGVIIRTSRIMPYKRLVFAGGYSTPLARALGLKGVVLRAARADIRIPEMDSAAADRLILGVAL